MACVRIGLPVTRDKPTAAFLRFCMPNENTTQRITSLCLEIDKKASDIYRHLSRKLSDVPTAVFFKDMAKEELGHVAFWAKFSESPHQCLAPYLFEDADKVVEELKERLVKATKISNSITDDVTAAQAFFIAYKLEFYLLHPAFESIFQHCDMIPSGNLPAVDYDNHIYRFVNALKEHATESPELELIGEMLGSLWIENKKLSKKSVTDDLTQILNRRGFFNAVVPLSYVALRSGVDVGVLMCDLDHFKKINDTLGHQKGDDLLLHVAWMIKESVRKSDVVARYGGEEFIVFLPEVRRDAVVEVAEKIRRAVEERTKPTTPVTVSIGISSGQFGSDDVEKELEGHVKYADDNLYKAKNTGRNRVVA